MRSLTKLLLIGGLSTFLIVSIVGIGVWTIATNRPASAPTLIVKDSKVAASVSAGNPVAGTDYSAQIATVQQTTAERAAQYEQRIQELQSTINARQTEYQVQIEVAAKQLNTYRQAIAQKEENLAALNTQADELNTALAERQTTYQTQLTQTQMGFEQRKAQFVAQLQEAQAALSAAWSQLGR